MSALHRLVYSPKAWVYVKTQERGVVDISDFVVSGEVNRVINEISTATVTLRNSPDAIVTNSKGTGPGHYGRFTVNPKAQVGDPDAKPWFHPMDPITVYFSRFAEKPVQVFTGYLDTTPYVQLFPGTITLQASCTLKRLLYTFFDPALPFTFNFLGEFGWLNNTQGQLINTNALKQGTSTTDPHLTDAGFGELLYAVLNRIGGWRDDQIHIEKLPPDLVNTVVGIYNSFVADNTDAENQFVTLLERMMGTSGRGSAGNAGADPGTVHGLNRIVPYIKQYADQAGIPPLFVLTVGFAESNWDPNASNTDRGGHYGYFQTQVLGPPYSYYSQKMVTPQQAKDIGYVGPLFCNAAKYWLDKNPSYGKESNWEAWAEKVQGAGAGPGIYPSWTTNLQQAKNVWSKYKDLPVTPSGQQTAGGLTAQGKKVKGHIRTQAHPPGDKTVTQPSSSDTFTQPIADAPHHIVSPWAQNRGNHLHAGVDIGAPVGTAVHASLAGIATVDTTSDPRGYGWFITIDHQNGLFTRYAHLSHISIKNGATVTAGEIIGLSGGAPGAQGSGDAQGPHLHFEVRKNAGFGFAGTVDPTTYFHGAVVPSQTTVTTNGTNGTNSTTDGTITSNAIASAFATSIEFPGIEETKEAVALQGQKSLMNDKPLLPFVQQLAGASMRQFMSLPNGSFIAFYPDFFGTYGHRAPYWEIDDIEILDGKIELSDDALATHVYVVGNTFAPASDPSQLVNKIASGGVVTIFNAFNTGDWMIEGNKSPLGSSTSIPTVSQGRGKKGKLKQPASLVENINSKKSIFGNTGKVLAFLQKFGARPLYKEEPFIRSPYFEAFMAFTLFQLAWSKQFLTTISLTFMPELYPGGRVFFKNHGFACYVDAVTHSFDYTGGFTTSVNFSAPSAYTGVIKQGDPPTIDHNPIAQGMIRSL